MSPISIFARYEQALTDLTSAKVRVDQGRFEVSRCEKELKGAKHAQGELQVKEKEAKASLNEARKALELYVAERACPRTNGKGHEIRLSEALVSTLKAISNDEVVNRKKLAAKLKIGTATLAQRVNKLIDKRLLERPSWGYLGLTEAGKKAKKSKLVDFSKK